MRLFFLMLLLLNGAFFAVNALREPTVDNEQDHQNTNLPTLALLSELNNQKEPLNERKVTRHVTETPKKAEKPSLDLTEWLAKFTSETPVVNNSDDSAEPTELTPDNTKLCYTAGPFKDSEKLQQASDFFSDLNIQYQQRSIIENHYIGMLVYLPGQESRDKVVGIANSLAAKGVKDYMLLNEPGKRHSLSLGVYGLKKNAEQRIKALAKLNYFAKSEARYRKKTIYWLDYELEDTENQTILGEQQMKSLNVSQIQRNCNT